jgi:hypothetical protein
MDNFEKTPPRSLKSFGVSGLLAENCRVIYSNLFTTKHLGRVSDLLSARLREFHPDELKFRALLLFSAFEAFRLLVKNGGQESLTEPIRVECGVDDERVAIGVGFTPSETETIKTEGLSDRITRGEPDGYFEEFLMELFKHANHLIVRSQPHTRRAEIIAILGLAGQLEEVSVGSHCVIDVAILEDEAEESPRVESYLELGDLDYLTLLRDQRTGVPFEPVSSGEIIVGAFNEAQALLKTRIGAQEDPGDKSKKVIFGATEKLTDDLIRVKGSGENLRDETLVLVKGNDTQSSLNPNDPVSRVYLARISELQKKIEHLEADRAQAKVLVGEQSYGSGGLGSAIKGIFNKGWAFWGQEDKKQAAQDVSVVKDVEKSPEIVEMDKLDSTINKAQDEIVEIKKDIGSPRAKKWVDNLMTDLVTEKSRLHEFAKGVSLTLRQKELEYKKKENGYQEELKRCEEMLRQKNYAMNRMKDQLNQLTVSYERLKAVGHSSTDETYIKQKYTHLQKVMNIVKEENAQLTRKLDELRGHLSSSQLASKVRATNSEVNTLQTRLDRTQKQVEELRKMNQQLMEKLTASVQRGRVSQPNREVDELKKIVDGSMRMIVTHKKEIERLNARHEELNHEKLRLKVDLSRAQGELNRLKSEKASIKKSRGSSTPGDSGPGDPSAAA